MSGACRRSLQNFQAMCGDDALCNAIVVTTMWDNVDPRDGVEREFQLKSGEEFFEPFLRKGAHMLRHNGGIESARRIVSTMLGNKPRPLVIQVEMVKQHKLFLETRVGRQLSKEFKKTMQDLDKQIAASEVAEGRSIGSEGGAGGYFDEDDESEREELLKQLALYQREMKNLEDEYHADGEESHQKIRQAKNDIGRRFFFNFYRHWIRRNGEQPRQHK